MIEENIYAIITFMLIYSIAGCIALCEYMMKEHELMIDYDIKMKCKYSVWSNTNGIWWRYINE